MFLSAILSASSSVFLSKQRCIMCNRFYTVHIVGEVIYEVEIEALYLFRTYDVSELQDVPSCEYKRIRRVARELQIPQQRPNQLHVQKLFLVF